MQTVPHALMRACGTDFLFCMATECQDTAYSDALLDSVGSEFSERTKNRRASAELELC